MLHEETIVASWSDTDLGYAMYNETTCSNRSMFLLKYVSSLPDSRELR